MAVKQKIQNLLQHLNNGVYEKNEAITLALLSAVAGESIFLLGAPGVAKSLIARRLKFAFKDGKTFEYLMSRFSTPDEIFGPVSISKLKDEDKYERIVKNYLPDAEIVFLDEIWKAGPSIQNSLLTVINEKVFRNGEQEIKVPMKALISASNELPAQNEGLEALWDRFLVRLVVEGVQKQESFNAMISENLDSYKDNVDNSLKITNAEYEQWSKEIDKIEIPANVFNVIDVIRKKLQAHNDNEKNTENQIYISDRRWRKIVRLLRTSAFLNDRNAVDLMDCFLIKECLWNEEGQRNLIYQIVRDVIQNYGYNITPKLNAIENELADFWEIIAQKTSYIKNIAIPKIYDNSYFKILDVLNQNLLIEIETYNELDDNYSARNLFADNRGYYRSNTSYRIKAGKQVNTISFDERIKQGEYDYNTRKYKEVVEIKRDTIKKVEVLTFKKTTTNIPYDTVINKWNDKVQQILDITKELKSNIEQYEKQDLGVYNSNILVNKDNTKVFIENLQHSLKFIEKLEIEVKRIKNFYEQIKQDDNISLSMLNLVTKQNHFALKDLINFDFKQPNERNENKFFTKEKCKSLEKFNVVNSNDFLNISKELISKLLDGDRNYERFKEIVINRAINTKIKLTIPLNEIEFEWDTDLEIYDDKEEENIYISELELLQRHNITTSDDFLSKEKSVFEEDSFHDLIDEDKYNEIKKAIMAQIIISNKIK